MVKTQPGRIYSIDVFRAVTMVLMIFVNDFWTLADIPEWLQHAPAQADRLGFSDIIFPGFLFIAGLSIPFALDKRLEKQSPWQVFRHILSRSVALIIMGIFIVNLENIYPAAMVLPKPLWQILMVLGFMLVWNHYKLMDISNNRVAVLSGAGILILVALAYFFRGGDEEQVTYMQRHWWGILGLIGWAYFYSASIYLLFKGKWVPIASSALFFLLYNLLHFAGKLDFLEVLQPGVWMPGHGAFAAFSILGILAGMMHKTRLSADHQKMILAWLLFSMVMLLYGYLLRPYFGISKIRATASWIGYCTGISLLAYIFFYWLVDVKNVRRWAVFIKPAGTSTLTCYLVPYVYYALWSIGSIMLPISLRTGVVGLLKSLLFALLIVAITGVLNKWKISLKI